MEKIDEIIKIFHDYQQQSQQFETVRQFVDALDHIRFDINGYLARISLFPLLVAQWRETVANFSRRLIDLDLCSKNIEALSLCRLIISTIKNFSTDIPVCDSPERMIDNLIDKIFQSIERDCQFYLFTNFISQTIDQEDPIPTPDQQQELYQTIYLALREFGLAFPCSRRGEFSLDTIEIFIKYLSFSVCDKVFYSTAYQRIRDNYLWQDEFDQGYLDSVSKDIREYHPINYRSNVDLEWLRKNYYQLDEYRGKVNSKCLSRAKQKGKNNLEIVKDYQRCNYISIIDKLDEEESLIPLRIRIPMLQSDASIKRWLTANIKPLSRLEQLLYQEDSLESLILINNSRQERDFDKKYSRDRFKLNYPSSYRFEELEYWLRINIPAKASDTILEVKDYNDKLDSLPEDYFDYRYGEPIN